MSTMSSTMSNIFSTQNIKYAGYIFAILGAVAIMFGYLKTGLMLLALGIIIVAVNK